jgi:WD40 repeat protein
VAAAACVPVAWPVLIAAGAGSGAAALVGAAFSQVSGVGGNLLAEAVIRSWDRLRSRRPAGAEQADLRDALAAELEAGLAQRTPAAAALREEIAAVLRGVDAVQVALTATIEESAGGVRDVLVRGLRALGQEFAEFGWVLDEVNVQLAFIAEDVARAAATAREVADNQQQTLVELAMLRQEARSAFGGRAGRSDAAGPAGPSADEERVAALDAAAVPVSADCPYLGLAAFQPEDAGRFFGREQLTAELVARAGELLACPGLLVVLGPSGSGKSSLLRAGLLPAVVAGALPVRGSWAWPRDVMTPGRRPLMELATRIASLAGVPAGALEADLRTDPARITGAIRQGLLSHTRRQMTRPSLTPVPGRVLADPGADQNAVAAPDSKVLAAARSAAAGLRLVLIVDQFEEVFSQCSDEQERRTFIQSLCAAAGAGACGTGTHGDPACAKVDAREAPALVVIGMRADFYARAAVYPELIPHLQDHQVLVGPLDEAGLREAIEKPAAAAGLVTDAALVEVLLADIGLTTRPDAAAAITTEEPIAATAGRNSYAAGRLALLGYALEQTWRNRDGRRLTVARYKATGGIDRAVAQAADNLYDGLDPAGRDALQRILLRLVTFGDGTPDSRRRVDLTELTGPGDSTQSARTRAVLADLADARLVTAGTDAVEITHETLLTAWPRLRRWLTEDRAGLRIHRDLTEATRHWEQNGHDRSDLFRGTRLAVTRDWATQRDQDLNPGERAFLSASQRDQTRSSRWRRAAATVLAAVTLIASTATVVAVHYARNATRQHAIALSRQLAAESLSLDPGNPVTARRLAVAAWRVYPTSQASAAMTTLIEEQQQNGDLPVAPSGSAPDGDAKGAHGAAFSPNGSLLATAGADGYVRLWDPATGKPTGQPLPADPGPNGSVNAVAFSPSSKLLATAGGDGYVRLWDLATGKPVGKAIHADFGSSMRGPGGFGHASVDAVAFSPDGSLLATAGADGHVRLWNPATGRSVGKPLPADPGSGNPVDGVAFSPDGKLLASAGPDGYVRLWNPATGKPTGQPLPADPGPNGSVNAVAFSPHGNLLATAGGDGYVRLWNPVTGRSAGQPLPADPSPTGGVVAVSFSPSGKLLASAGGDGFVRLWNPVTGRPASQPLPADPVRLSSAHALDALTFSPDGSLLATADVDGYVRLWDPVTGRPVGQPVPADPGPDFVDGVAFSSDGKLLASAGGDGYVRLWDPVTGRPAGKPMRAASRSNPVDQVAFSPDGSLLASADADGYVRLWDPVTGKPVGKPLPADPGNGNGVDGVAFSPDGSLLASAGGDGYVRLWDPVTGRPVGKPLHAEVGRGGPVTNVYAVAFSPDGKLLASGGVDGYVRLWDPATGRPVGKPLPADPRNENGVHGVAFSPDGKLLASADADGYVRLWDPATGRPVGRPLPANLRNGNGVHGVAFSPDGKLLASAGSDGYVRLWDPVTGRPVGEPMPADPGQGIVDGVAFSPDGSLLASADAIGAIETWRVWLFADPYAALCADVGPPTKADWTHYAPGEPQPNICTNR